MAAVRIIHFDDDPIFLDEFRDRLAQDTLLDIAEIESISSESVFWRKLREKSFDAIVLDVQLGKVTSKSGAELAAAVRSEFPNLAILLCSELHDVQFASRALRSAADDYIFKGADDAEIALRLRGAIEKYAQTDGAEVAKYAGPTMSAIGQRFKKINNSAITAVHVFGESGTGKEVVADLLEQEMTSGIPFVRVNCGALSPTLLESELFGHVKGAFTGATQNKRGLIESAHRGWLFLDEVANLTASAQISLLRVLESKKVRRLGATEEHQVDVRVLTATNEPIAELVKRGDFRQDLWQRLCETTLNLPPLRERMGELRELVDWFLGEMAGGPYRITDSAFEMLASYDWKGGNIRELRNTLRAMTENAVGGLLTPLGFSEQFWSVLGDEKEGQVEDSGEAADGLRNGKGKIELTWNGDQQPTFTALADDLLIALIKYHVDQPGKNSIRSLAAKVGIPKSSLSTKIRSLISAGCLDISEYERWFDKA